MMFDFDRLQLYVQDHYFRLFRFYNKPDETKYFIKRWLEFLRSYSELKEFVSFDRPVLKRLVPRAKAVILIMFPNVPIVLNSPFLSVFPYRPFRVKLETRDICPDVGLEFLHMY